MVYILTTGTSLTQVIEGRTRSRALDLDDWSASSSCNKWHTHSIGHKFRIVVMVKVVSISKEC
jgi:hypothetical protein